MYTLNFNEYNVQAHDLSKFTVEVYLFNKTQYIIFIKSYEHNNFPIQNDTLFLSLSLYDKQPLDYTWPDEETMVKLHQNFFPTAICNATYHQ